MFARDIIRTLRTTLPGSKETLPIVIQGDAVYSEAVFLRSASLQLKRINPVSLEINKWPTTNMTVEDVKKLMDFITSNVKCFIVFDFSKQSDEWMESFYEHASAVYPALTTKPILIYYPPINSTINWSLKLYDIKSPADEKPAVAEKPVTVEKSATTEEKPTSKSFSFSNLFNLRDSKKASDDDSVELKTRARRQ